MDVTNILQRFSCHHARRPPAKIARRLPFRFWANCTPGLNVTCPPQRAPKLAFECLDLLWPRSAPWYPKAVVAQNDNNQVTARAQIGHYRPVDVTFQFLLVGPPVIEVSVRYSAIRLTTSLPRPDYELPVDVAIQFTRFGRGSSLANRQYSASNLTASSRWFRFQCKYWVSFTCNSTAQCKRVIIGRQECILNAQQTRNFVTEPLKQLVLAAAKQLFLTRGYDAVGMRDIAQAVGRQPVQIYRLDLAKSDILAELIIELNAEEIRQLPELLAKVNGESLIERVCGYFQELYRLDIQYMPIRSVGAAFGWMWNTRYEQQIIGQVLQLLQPVAGWMIEAGLEGIEARGYGIWSVYYVGFRRAAIHGGSAEECIAEIRPTLEILLQNNAGLAPAPSPPRGVAS